MASDDRHDEALGATGAATNRDWEHPGLLGEELRQLIVIKVSPGRTIQADDPFDMLVRRGCVNKGKEHVAIGNMTRVDNLGDEAPRI